MTLFTPMQLRVLKISWIPVMLIWLMTAGLEQGLLNINTSMLVAVFGNTFMLPLAIMAAWEMLVRKEWRNAFIMVAVVALVAALQQALSGVLKQQADQDMAFLIEKLNLFAGILIVFITRFYLSGRSEKLAAAFIAALIYFVLPANGVPLNSLQLVRDLPVYNLVSASIAAWLGLLATYCFFISYYVIVYLLENIYRWEHVRLLLQSRVQVLTKWEYFFLFVSVCFVYAGAIGVLETNIYQFFEEGPQPVPVAGFMLFSILAMVLLLYTGAGLMRNVVTSRALTVGKYSYWILLAHFIPVVNIGAVVYLFFAKDAQQTVATHANTYLTQDRKVAQYAMIAAGIVVTVFNLYMLMTRPTGLRLPAIGVLTALYQLKIFVYTRLRTGRTAVMLVMVLNIVTVLFANSGHLILLMASLYLYYYLLLELFCPKLEIEDTIETRQPETGDIFTHTA